MRRSESQKGKKRPPFSEEWKHRLGLAWKGKHHTAETKQKMSKSMTGVGKTPQARFICDQCGESITVGAKKRHLSSHEHRNKG
jgi:hypothetical protein